MVDRSSRELGLDLGGVGLVAVHIHGHDDTWLFGRFLEHCPHLRGLLEVVRGAGDRDPCGLHESVELAGEVADLGFVAWHRPHRGQVPVDGLGSRYGPQHAGGPDTVGVVESRGRQQLFGRHCCIELGRRT